RIEPVTLLVVQANHVASDGDVFQCDGRPRGQHEGSGRLTAVALTGDFEVEVTEDDAGRFDADDRALRGPDGAALAVDDHGPANDEGTLELLAGRVEFQHLSSRQGI